MDKVFYKTTKEECLCLKHAISKINNGQEIVSYVSTKKGLECIKCVTEQHDEIMRINKSFTKPEEGPKIPEPRTAFDSGFETVYKLIIKIRKAIKNVL